MAITRMGALLPKRKRNLSSWRERDAFLIGRVFLIEDKICFVMKKTMFFSTQRIFSLEEKTFLFEKWLVFPSKRSMFLKKTNVFLLIKNRIFFLVLIEILGRESCSWSINISSSTDTHSG